MYSAGDLSFQAYAQLVGDVDHEPEAYSIEGVDWMEVWVDGAWHPSVFGAVFTDAWSTPLFTFESADPVPGTPWRFRPSFNLTINGQPITPRSGIVEAMPEGMMAAKIAVIKALTGSATRTK